MVYHHTNGFTKIMIKRISFVWKRPELTHEQFRDLWLGEHVQYARQLAGVREYVIDFVTQGPTEGPAGVATLRFDSQEDLDAAFGDHALAAELVRTRAQFAQSVQVLLVTEEIVIQYQR